MNDFLQSLRNGQAEKPRTPKTRKNFDNSYHYSSPSRFNSYGGGGYQNTRSQQMKRPPAIHQQGNQLPAIDDNPVISMLAEAIESLSRHIESLAKNQDYLVTVQERTADILERQAFAIERIVNHLNIESGQIQPRQKNTPKFENHYVTTADPQPEEMHEPEPVTEPAVKAPEPVKAAKPVIRRRKKIVPSKTQAAPASDSKLLGRDAIMEIIQTMRKDGATYDQVASHLIELGQPTFSGRGEWHAQTIHRLCSKK